MNLLSEHVTRIQKLAGVNKPSVLKEYFRSGPEVDGFFGMKLKSRTYKDSVMCEILNILMEVHQISEKAFQSIDDTVEKLQSWVDGHTSEFDSLITPCEQQGVREQMCAELCYEKFFRNTDALGLSSKDQMNEAKKSEFERLKDNKKPLTDEERDQVMKADAVWNHGPKGGPSPAVWKSVNKNGDVTYVTNTHRCFQTAKTLKGAITKFHEVVKETA